MRCWSRAALTSLPCFQLLGALKRGCFAGVFLSPSPPLIPCLLSLVLRPLRVRRNPLFPAAPLVGPPAPSELGGYKPCTQLTGKGGERIRIFFLWKGIWIIWADSHGCDLAVFSPQLGRECWSLQVQFVRPCCRHWAVLPSLPWAPGQPLH